MAISDWLGLTRPQPRIEPLPEQKAVTGPGAYSMTYDAPISSGRWDTSSGMKRAQAMSHTNPWMDKAERIVSGRASGLPWHLETPDGETVDDDSPPQLRAVRDLLEGGTNGALTWRQRAAFTYRHMGVVNVGAWYLDGLDANMIPSEILYLNPARLTPYQPSGVLEAWLLDADNEYGWNARRLELDEVVLFVLDPPDFGYFGRGLVEVADGKAALSRSVDRYATQTFASGGRKGSFIMPKEGRLDDDVYEALVNSMRNVRESYDSAKRDVVTKAPLDIVPQAATAQELQAADIMRLSREDILLIWNIDLADAGIPGGAGLSSGDMRQQARQSTQENAVDPRVDVFLETTQLRLLDRYKAIGIELELVLDRPTWKDETEDFTRAQIALALPLRNRERREMIGLDPMGDPVLDEAVWLPLGYAEAYTAPDQDGKPVPPPPSPDTSDIQITAKVEAAGQLIRAGFEPAAALTAVGLDPIKHLGLLPITVQSPEEATALLASVNPVKASPLARTRAHVDRKVTPAMRKDVGAVLADQKAEVLRLVREKASHLAAKPGDLRAIWNEKAWNAAMARAIGNHVSVITDTVAATTQKSLGHLKPGKAEPAFLDNVKRFVLKRGGDRVVEINNTTRDAIIDAIRTVISAASKEVGDDGRPKTPSVPELASRLTDAVGGLSTWDEARADRIARTETMFAYNDSALGSYREYGVEMVEPIDGDQDEECLARLARGAVTIEEALADSDHPNGTLDWVPVLGKASVEQADVLAWATTNAENAGRALEAVTALQLSEAHKAQTADLAGVLGMLAEAMSRPQPAPVVNVPAPVVNIPAPVVNVPAPVVNVAPPDLTGLDRSITKMGESLKPRSSTRVVKRDNFGRIETVRDVVDG